RALPDPSRDHSGGGGWRRELVPLRRRPGTLRPRVGSSGTRAPPGPVRGGTRAPPHPRRTDPVRILARRVRGRMDRLAATGRLPRAHRLGRAGEDGSSRPPEKQVGRWRAVRCDAPPRIDGRPRNSPLSWPTGPAGPAGGGGTQSPGARRARLFGDEPDVRRRPQSPPRTDRGDRDLAPSELPLSRVNAIRPTPTTTS